MCQVERILKNPFYYGEFRWAGETYQGNHEPLICRSLFEDTQRAFRRHNKPQLNRKEFAFGNLMACAHCGCKITAEIKKGKYVYYHCTGMRGGCDLVYVREIDIVDQFSAMNAPLVLTQKQAHRIMTRLSKRHASAASRIQAEQSRIQARLSKLNTWSEKAYLDKLEGSISDDHWKRLTVNWDAETIRLQSQQDNLGSERPDVLFTAERILELAQKLPALWDKQNPFEKRKLVDLLYSNCQLDGASLSAAYRKPFSFIAEGAQSQQKRRGRDSNPG